MKKKKEAHNFSINRFLKTKMNYLDKDPLTNDPPFGLFYFFIL